MQEVGGQVGEMIRQACEAGRNWAHARNFPKAAGIYEEAASDYSRRVAALAETIAMGSVGALPSRIRST